MGPDPNNLKLITDAYRSYLGLSDDDMMVVEAIAAVIYSTALGQCKANPWIDVSGVPGSAKTECLLPWQDHPSVYWLSSLTEKSLISGLDKDDGVDHSLLPKLQRKTLIVKEMSGITKMNPDSARIIMGQLRDIYDGTGASKAFGTGVRSYRDIVMGFIGAGTPELDAFLEDQADLGERILTVRMARDRYHRDRAWQRKYLMGIQKRAATKHIWRPQLKGLVLSLTEWWANASCYSESLTFTEAYDFRLSCLSEFVGRARTLPNKHIREPEQGTRLIQQLSNLATARAYIERRDGENGREGMNDLDYRLACRVAFDTIPPTARSLLLVLYRHPAGMSINDIHYTTKIEILPLADKLLPQFWHSRLVDKQANSDRWGLHPDARADIDDTGIFQPNITGDTK